MFGNNGDSLYGQRNDPIQYSPSKHGEGVRETIDAGQPMERTAQAEDLRSCWFDVAAGLCACWV